MTSSNQNQWPITEYEHIAKSSSIVIALSFGSACLVLAFLAPSLFKVTKLNAYKSYTRENETSTQSSFDLLWNWICALTKPKRSETLKSYTHKTPNLNLIGIETSSKWERETSKFKLDQKREVPQNGKKNVKSLEDGKQFKIWKYVLHLLYVSMCNYRPAYNTRGLNV